MSYPGSLMFRALTDEEEYRFRKYAQKNDPPTTTDWSFYHPVCREEWIRRGLKDPDNPDGITDVHGTPVHDELACEEDCLNCGEHVGPDGDRVVIARVTKQGELDETDSWRVCPDCSSNTSIRQAVAATLR